MARISSPRNSSTANLFKQGDFCRTHVDDVIYECQVLSLLEEGKVKLKTLGFGLEITRISKELLPSSGKSARTKQEEEASGIYKADTSLTDTKEVEWKVGDFCLAMWNEDGVIYESKITEIVAEPEGESYVIVEFLGYGNSGSVWLQDLKPSNGDDARKVQIAQSEQEEIPEKVSRGSSLGISVSH